MIDLSMPLRCGIDVGSLSDAFSVKETAMEPREIIEQLAAFFHRIRVEGEKLDKLISGRYKIDPLEQRVAWSMPDPRASCFFVRRSFIVDFQTPSWLDIESVWAVHPTIPTSYRCGLGEYVAMSGAGSLAIELTLVNEQGVSTKHPCRMLKLYGLGWEDRKQKTRDEDFYLSLRDVSRVWKALDEDIKWMHHELDDLVFSEMARLSKYEVEVVASIDAFDREFGSQATT
jgi:hypothetical protein